MFLLRFYVVLRICQFDNISREIQYHAMMVANFLSFVNFMFTLDYVRVCIGGPKIFVKPGHNMNTSA
jgi:hypothetical protein